MINPRILKRARKKLEKAKIKAERAAMQISITEYNQDKAHDLAFDNEIVAINKRMSA